jgi:hypothetical protein
MSSFVTSRTAVTLWMAQESSLSAIRRSIGGDRRTCSRSGGTRQAQRAENLRDPKRRQRDDRWRRRITRQCCRHCRGELTIKSVEANMAKTAVGLFENPGSVEEVVRELKASGIPQKDVRVLREPREMASSGLMSTPHTDFEVGLVRDLRAFGVRRCHIAPLRVQPPPRPRPWP